MLRLGSIVLLVIVCLGTATPAKAQWFEKFFDRFKRDYHRNKMWPEPFLQADRQATMAPFAIQTANGWRRQNLISDYHFQDSEQLTLAGEIKLRYILTQMPPGRRTVFVQQGTSAEVTQGRLAAVDKPRRTWFRRARWLRSSSRTCPMTAGRRKTSMPITRKYNSSRPDPRLSSGGMSSGSGGYDSNSVK